MGLATDTRSVGLTTHAATRQAFCHMLPLEPWPGAGLRPACPSPSRV